MSPTPAAPAFSRTALAPGLLAAVLLVAGLALMDTQWFFAIRLVTCILALIVCVFVVQAKQYWWLIGLVPIVILWNPLVTIPIPDVPWRLLQLAAAIVFIVVGVVTKVPIERNADDQRRRTR